LKQRYWAHPTAVIDRGANIGEGTKLWHFCHVMPGARIGARCVLGQNAFVAAQVVIGDGCRIQNNVSIFDGVTLADEVFVGPSAVFTNVRTPRAFVNRRARIAPTVVGRGATIGANATIVCGVEIGEYAFVAAGSVVTSAVAPFALVVGVPARRTAWICKCGETIGTAQATRTCACAAAATRGGRQRKKSASATTTRATSSSRSSG
jgi:UDP-2-acetamido-3-amino-2,3-dideoxy-glucuronate N-acetyltransferase